MRNWNETKIPPEHTSWKSWNDKNPYYHPENIGLKTLGTLEDPNSSYDYSTVLVVQDIETKKVFAVHDSGCSCPTPFDEIDGLDAMTEIHTIEDLKNLIGSVRRTKYSQRDVESLIETVEKSLRDVDDE